VTLRRDRARQRNMQMALGSAFHQGRSS